MEQDTGGRAFPWCGDLNECPTVNLGMTLRDYFAAKALPRVMKEWADDRADGSGSTFDDDLHPMANDAYAMADAMLKARRTK